MWNNGRWPTKQEIKFLEEEEIIRAIKMDDLEDPICQCGNPGYCCQCEELYEILGYYPYEVDTLKNWD